MTPEPLTGIGSRKAYPYCTENKVGHEKREEIYKY